LEELNTWIFGSGLSFCSSGTRGRPLKGAVYICGKDRRFFVVGLMSGMQLDDHPWFSSKLFFRCCQEDRDLKEGEKC